MAKTKHSTLAQTPHTNCKAQWWRGDGLGSFWILAWILLNKQQHYVIWHVLPSCTHLQILLLLFFIISGYVKPERRSVHFRFTVAVFLVQAGTIVHEQQFLLPVCCANSLSKENRHFFIFLMYWITSSFPSSSGPCCSPQHIVAEHLACLNPVLLRQLLTYRCFN